MRNKFERPSIILFTLTIFILANLLLSSLPFRLDLSKGQAYTLSSSTKKIITKLDDIVAINFFFTSDLPTRLLPLKTEVSELLNEYQRNSRGKIVVKIIDQKKDEKSASEAKEFGIPELQFSQLEKDKYAVSTAYFGIGLTFAGKKDGIPQVTEPRNLEFNLTSSIYKLTRKEITKIGILGDQDSISNFKTLINQQFNLESITIDENTKEINKDVKTLIVFDDNKTIYNDKQIFLLKEYVEKGGKAVFFVDGVIVEDSLTTAETTHNLFSLLESYGIKLNKNLILSTSAELVNFGNSTVQFLTPYPLWIKTNAFNLKTSYFANINQLTFPWVSSLTLNKVKGIETFGIISSSKNSWEQKDSVFNLNPQGIPTPNEKDLKSFIMAAESKKKNSRIIVIPSSRFIQDRYLNSNSGNLEFALNILNDLASQGALAGIRSRTISFYPLPDLPETQKDIFKYSNILLLPVIFGVYGSIRLLRRK